jgi:SIR2-like protein
MNEKYYLKIGGVEVFDDKWIDDLDSADESVKKKANANLSERLKETRVRVGTLLKTDNVSFLIGAGASISAGGVGIASVPLTLERELNQTGTENGEPSDWLRLFYSSISAVTTQQVSAEDRKEILNQENKDQELSINLESFLSWLHIWRASMTENSAGVALTFPNDETLTVRKADADRLILEIDRSLTRLSDLPKEEKGEALRYHRRLIKKTLTRPLNLRRANLFTLNYDTLLEKAADAEGAILVDGFVGTLRRVFRPESYDLDFYFPAQTTEGRVHRFDRALHLYKLHGSVTWHRCEANWENPYGLFATFHDQTSPDDDVLIYPTPLKYGQALGMPYSELFRRFSSAIAQPQSVLFTIGYGFGDDHVNSLIRQALVIPSFTLVVVDPAPKSDFVKTLIDSNDERVWLVGGWELGTFENFVEKLLPDLREEEITSKVMKTYQALRPSVAEFEPEVEADDVE